MTINLHPTWEGDPSYVARTPSLPHNNLFFKLGRQISATIKGGSAKLLDKAINQSLSPLRLQLYSGLFPEVAAKSVSRDGSAIRLSKRAKEVEGE